MQQAGKTNIFSSEYQLSYHYNYLIVRRLRRGDFPPSFRGFSCNPPALASRKTLSSRVSALQATLAACRLRLSVFGVGVMVWHTGKVSLGKEFIDMHCGPALTKVARGLSDAQDNLGGQQRTDISLPNEGGTLRS